MTAQLNKIFKKYTDGEVYALRDPSFDERRVLFPAEACVTDPLDRRHRTVRGGPDPGRPTTDLRALRTGPLIDPAARTTTALRAE